MSYVDFISQNHKKAQRNYLARVNDPDFPKEKAAELAKKWDFDYWDGDRRVNYGGYHYDGRWVAVAEKLIAHYDLKAGDKVLDVGCGKGFLLYELQKLVPGLHVQGVDISEYALKNAKEEMSDKLTHAHAQKLPFEDNTFDLVISLNTLHNLYAYELLDALKEIERVSRKNSYICVESYRNETEKTNLLYWQVTCEAFNTPQEWEWWFNMAGYTGDHCFIYFE